ncbi:uncharacterized protein LOC113345522 isoform X1 [Papaver somniferum]|uniref:uncharacterized protein LOC113345522 isoform X1 n=1 Tax=Papaver somniferum TaxID=3469 RepID=UPI000E700E2A|nr:uncharacterized protein LOC113345522 isoform X1 [Papaver somniferum]
MYNSRITVSDCALKMGKSTSGGGDSSSLLMPGVKSDDRSRERKPRRIRCPAIDKTPDELEASFIQLYAAYSEAAAHNKEEGEFADCEKKLIEVIRCFRNLKIVDSNVRQLFPQVLDLKKAVPLMINLLKYDKCGKRLASCILITFEELTHVAFQVPSQEIQVGKLVESLFEMEALEVFASTLGKFSEDDDLRAVQTIAQMIFQGRAAVAKTAGSSRKLIIWVSAAIRGTKWDAKVCDVDFLMTLLMSYTENGLLLGRDTLPAVVDALSSLIMSPEEEKTEKQKRKEEEEDLPWTLFGCLFFLLEYPDNKVHFVNAGGIEAMIKLLQDGQKLGDYIYGSAIVALDIVKDCLAASDKFENDDLGLGIAIFPASMDMILPSTMHFKEEIEERLISLIESLTGGKTENYTLLAMFGENDCERITWLMELFTRYSKKVGAVANHLKSKQLDSFELYKKKCGDGFSTLQSIAVILGYLWLPEIKAKIESELSRHRIEKKLVLDVLSEYRDNIGNAGGTKTVIEKCIARLEENYDQSMELDAQENSGQGMELDVPEKPDQELEMEMEASSKRQRVHNRR